MKLKLLDTQTGKTIIVNAPEISEWDWIEGNWSFDRNRARCFKGIDWVTYYCIGCKRFLVVKLYDYLGSYTLREFNYNYPDELLNEYLK